MYFLQIIISLVIPGYTYIIILFISYLVIISRNACVYVIIYFVCKRLLNFNVRVTVHKAFNVKKKTTNKTIQIRNRGEKKMFLFAKGEKREKNELAAAVPEMTHKRQWISILFLQTSQRACRIV